MCLNKQSAHNAPNDHLVAGDHRASKGGFRRSDRGHAGDVGAAQEIDISLVRPRLLQSFPRETRGYAGVIGAANIAAFGANDRQSYFAQVISLVVCHVLRIGRDKRNRVSTQSRKRQSQRCRIRGGAPRTSF